MMPEEQRIQSRWPGETGETDSTASCWAGDPNTVPRECECGCEKDVQPAPGIEPIVQAESLGVPPQEAVRVETVKEKESVIARKRKELLNSMEAEMPDDDAEAHFGLNRFLRFTGMGSLIAIVISLTLLLVFSQVLSFLGRLADLPDWARLPGIAGMGILCAILLIALGRLFFLYLRLKRSPNLSVNALKQMAERTHIRNRSLDTLSEAGDALRRILASHPSVTSKTPRDLMNMGFTENEIALLRENSRRLLDSASRGSMEGWIDQYEKQFLRPLDQAARRRIRQYALRVGIRTAVVPTGFVDTSILLINSYQMIHDLCRIYGLRAGMAGTLAILMRIFFYAFAASRMEEWMDSATHQIMNAAVGGHDAFIAAINAVAQGVVSRVAEGSANAFLLTRLGAAAIRYLRPLS